MWGRSLKAVLQVKLQTGMIMFCNPTPVLEVEQHLRSFLGPSASEQATPRCRKGLPARVASTCPGVGLLQTLEGPLSVSSR